MVQKNNDNFNKLANLVTGIIGGTIPITKISQEDYKELKDAKGFLRGKLPEVLKLAKVPIDEHLRCFIHDDHDPSMVFNSAKNHLHCFSCHDDGRGWDIFDLVGFILGETKFANKRRLVERMFVDGVAEQAMQPAKSFQKATEAVRGVYKPYHTDPECVEFIKQRGITAASAVKYGLKWWVHPQTQDHYLVIPVQEKFVVRRRYKIVNGDPTQNKYLFPYNPDQLSEKKPKLFNGKILERCEEYTVIFVLESALDAILVDQMGYQAVAINSTGNADLLREALPLLKEKRLIVVLLLDNDEDGLRCAKDLAAELKAAGVMHYWHSYPHDGLLSYLTKVKDVGESYVTDADHTKDVVSMMETLVVQQLRPKTGNDQQIAPKKHGLTDQENPLKKWGFGGTWIPIGQIPNFVNKNKNDEEDGDLE
jgi:hypothetical protein